MITLREAVETKNLEAVDELLAEDVVFLRTVGVRPVVVHGGGPQISRMLDKLGIPSNFEGGLRVTDEATVEVVEMVLAGLINKQIVGFINAEGGRAIGLCGKDGNMVFAEKARKSVERMIAIGNPGSGE